jgi:hypothetical protein
MAKNLRTFKFYIKQVLEPVVIIFVHPFDKGGQKALTPPSLHLMFLVIWR